LRFEACPPSTVYRVRKFARRHRVAACSCSARRGRCCGAIRKQGC
jgi:hypothetical protein